ncbi:hypothetical protein ACFCP7_24585 [Paenibacillus elgii]
MSEERQSTQCTCGGHAVFIIDTVGLNVGDEEVSVHQVPHYRCTDCQAVKFGKDNQGLIELTRFAIVNKMREIDFSKKAEHLIKFKIQLDDATRRKVEEAIFHQMGLIQDQEDFVVIIGQKCFCGVRQKDRFLIINVINRVL